MLCKFSIADLQHHSRQGVTIQVSFLRKIIAVTMRLVEVN
jgi:hypothetical protein